MYDKDYNGITNADIVRFNKEVLKLGWSRISRKDENAFDIIKLRTSDYYELCEMYNQKPTWEGLSLALGVSRSTLSKWRQGEIEWTKGEIQEFIDLQWTFLNAVHVSMMEEGKLNPISGIFIARNNYGYVNDDRKTETREINVKFSVSELLEQAKNLQIEQKD